MDAAFYVQSIFNNKRDDSDAAVIIYYSYTIN